MKSIAILLTVFNRKDKTLACLKRLYDQLSVDGCEVDVYLTDDGCTDGTPEAVAAEFPDVCIIAGGGDLFWNRGMHAAWERAAQTQRYDFYLWLNDDTFVCDDMLKALVEASAQKEDKAIIVGATQSADHTRTTYGGRQKTGKVVEPDGTLAEVNYFNGNIVLVPASVYDVLGNLDYYFTHSKGDFDYGLRAGKCGIKMFQVGRYLGECDAHPTLDKWCNPDVPLRQRWKMLYRPNGMPPLETFHLEKRHFSLSGAVLHFVTIHVRCLFPCLWNRRNRKQFNTHTS